MCERGLRSRPKNHLKRSSKRLSKKQSPVSSDSEDEEKEEPTKMTTRSSLGISQPKQFTDLVNHSRHQRLASSQKKGSKKAITLDSSEEEKESSKSESESESECETKSESEEDAKVKMKGKASQEKKEVTPMAKAIRTGRPVKRMPSISERVSSSTSSSCGKEKTEEESEDEEEIKQPMQVVATAKRGRGRPKGSRNQSTTTRAGPGRSLRKPSSKEEVSKEEDDFPKVKRAKLQHSEKEMEEEQERSNGKETVLSTANAQSTLKKRIDYLREFDKIKEAIKAFERLLPLLAEEATMEVEKAERTGIQTPDVQTEKPNTKDNVECKDGSTSQMRITSLVSVSSEESDDSLFDEDNRMKDKGRNSTSNGGNSQGTLEEHNQATVTSPSARLPSDTTASK